MPSRRRPYMHSRPTALTAPPDISPFRRRAPCWGIENSLFRAFQTTKKKGLGIGLFHCKLIVEAHRGTIEVNSAVGKGTEFRVILPVA